MCHKHKIFCSVFSIYKHPHWEDLLSYVPENLKKKIQIKKNYILQSHEHVAFPLGHVIYCFNANSMKTTGLVNLLGQVQMH